MVAVSFQRWAFGALTVHALLLSRNSWSVNNTADEAVLYFGLCAGAAALGAFTAAILSTFLLSDRSEKSTTAVAPHRQVHLIAAMAIATVTKCSPLEGFQIAKESLLSGKGLVALNKLKELSK